MKRFNRFGLITGLAVVAAVAPAFASNVTVGRFYTEIAKAKHISVVDAASAEAGLRGAGYSLPTLALDKSLTEGDMAAISKSVGLSVTTTRPSSPISESQMNQFVGSFGDVLGAGSIVIGDPPSDGGVDTQSHDGGSDPNPGDGKGKKKGHNKSTSEPM